MPANKSKLYILYGSATGNAEQIAKDLAKSASGGAEGEDVLCGSLESFRRYQTDWATPSIKKGLIVICSTSGNGDSPENASKFVRFIKRKTTPETTFENIPFAVLGLGDTNYDQFCGAAKTIDKALATKGGRRLQELQCADEALGLEAVVEPFIETIVDKMRQAMNEDPAAAKEEESAKEPTTDTTSSSKVTPKSLPPTPPLVVEEEKKDDSSPELLASTLTTVSSSPLCILYGSATGNAEFIAKDLQKAYKGTFFPDVVCAPLNNYKKLKLLEQHWSQAQPGSNKHAVLIVCSTTGNGDIPENGDRFVRWLARKSTAEDVMQHVNYAVLALGDTNYDQFCEAGKKIDSLMKKRQATPVVPLTCADEATGLEDTVEPWKHSIVTKLEEACRGVVCSSPTTVVSGDTIPSATNTAATTTVTSEEVPAATNATAKSSTTATTSSSFAGVAMIRQLLQKRTNGVLPTLKNSTTADSQQCKPTPLRTLQILTEEEQLAHAAIPTSDSNSILEWDRQTISTVSSSGIIYTHLRPYGSHIVQARYLTQQTSTVAAQKASDILGNDTASSNFSDVYDCFNAEFDLQKDPYASKRVMELTLSLPDDFSLSYEPGDSLGLLVPNPPAVVKEFCNLFQLTSPELDQLVSLCEQQVVTLQHVLTHIVDLSSPLTNKNFLKRLLQQIDVLLLSSASTEVDTSEERQALQAMIKDFTNDEWESFFCEKYTIVEFMQHFSCLTKCISWMDWITILLPPQAPRYYSVSSSPLSTAADLEPTVTIAFSVVDYTTPSGKRKGGVATRYLEALASTVITGGGSCSEKLAIFPKPTTEFRLPPTLSTPLVLIGPGTGIAPFIGFLQHRLAQFRQKSRSSTNMLEGTWRGSFEIEDQADQPNKLSSPPIHVYFGCRHANHDYLYKEELEELYQEKQLISQLNVAISRPTTEGSKKQYVQDLLSDKTMDLIVHQDASVYICGDGNHMAKDVQAKLVELLAKAKSGVDDPEGYLRKMKEQQRFVMDIWS